MTAVLMRFMDEKELKTFQEEYENNLLTKGMMRFIPTAKEMEIFNEGKYSYEQWKSHWGLKNKYSVLGRLGRMGLVKNEQR